MSLNFRFASRGWSCAQKFILALVVSGTILLFGCGENALDPVANKETDLALMQQAKIELNQRRYDRAVRQLEMVSGAGQLRSDYRRLAASAFAGRCGFDFIEFFQSVSAADFSNLNYFIFAMTAYSGTAVNPEDCEQAGRLLQSISPLSSRSEEDKLFGMLLGLSKVGTFTRSRADNDGPNGNGDGAVDPGFNSCADFSDNDVRNISSGLAMFLVNLLAATTDVLPSANSQDLLDFIDLCDTIASGACSETDPDAVPAPAVDGFRNILHSDGLGLGGCGEGDPALIPTCCP